MIAYESVFACWPFVYFGHWKPKRITLWL